MSKIFIKVANNTVEFSRILQNTIKHSRIQQNTVCSKCLTPISFLSQYQYHQYGYKVHIHQDLSQSNTLLLYGIYQSRYNLCITPWSTRITSVCISQVQTVLKLSRSLNILQSVLHRNELFSNSLVPLIYPVGFNPDTTILYSSECIITQVQTVLNERSQVTDTVQRNAYRYFQVYKYGVYYDIYYKQNTEKYSRTHGYNNLLNNINIKLTCDCLNVVLLVLGIVKKLFLDKNGKKWGKCFN